MAEEVETDIDAQSEFTLKVWIRLPQTRATTRRRNGRKRSVMLLQKLSRKRVKSLPLDHITDWITAA
ncbi:hypothetical protein V6N13_038233 [Hibiscus sabdariffa]|uniref:Uncharacterized protein n=1 Tax=Hibiscus sabdariffa TaxID=183260 RepID=A0ABR2S2R9_9ROSI